MGEHMKTKTHKPMQKPFSKFALTKVTAGIALAVFGAAVSAQTMYEHLTKDDVEMMKRLKMDPKQKELVADFVNHIRGESAKYGIDPKQFVGDQPTGESGDYRLKKLAEKQRIREENAKKIAEYKAMQEERKAKGLPVKEKISEDQVAEIFAKTAGLSAKETEDLKEAIRPKEDKDVVPGFEKPIDATEELKNTDELFMDQDELRRREKERQKELARKKKKEDQQDILKRIGTEKSKLRIELERFNRRERMKARAEARDRDDGDSMEDIRARERAQEAEERKRLLMDSPYFHPKAEGDGHSFNDSWVLMPRNAQEIAEAATGSPIGARGQTNLKHTGVSATPFGLTSPANPRKTASLRAVKFLFPLQGLIPEAQAQTKPQLSAEELRIEAPAKNVITADEELHWRNRHEELQNEVQELAQSDELQTFAKEALAAKDKYSAIAEQTKTASEGFVKRFGSIGSDNGTENDDSKAADSVITDRIYTIFISESMGHENIRNLFKAYAGKPNVQFAIRGFKGEGTFEEGLKWMYGLTAGMEELPNVILDSAIFKRHSVDRVPAMIVEEVTNIPAVSKDAALIESYVKSLEMVFSDNPPALQQITQAKMDSAPKQSEPELRLRVYGVTSLDWVNDRLDTKKDETVDIGSFGTTYPIEEKDFEEIAKERAAKIDWEAKKEAALKRYWSNREDKFVTLPRAGEDRVREFDPSIVVPQDIYDNAGNILHKAGSKFNPFDRSPFTKELIIYDSTDPAQVEIAKAWVADCRSRNVRFKLITTKIDTKKGWDAFTDVNKNWKTELYLLNSDIRDRFGVQKVPTRIRANQAKKIFELEELRPILGRTIKVSHRTGDRK
jgi:conjugal transfer pilus assembly protein TraW